MTYRDRREARAARLQEWAGKREAKAATAFDQAHTMADQIPFGQPILAGHYSQGRDTRYRARIDATMGRAVEHAHKAEAMGRRAEHIQEALEASIYDDDADAIERLKERIAALEGERKRITDYNKSCRKGQPDESVLDDRQRATLESLRRTAPMFLRANGAFPSYATSNLGGRITKDRQRLERLRGLVHCLTPGCPATFFPVAGVEDRCYDCRKAQP